MAKRTPRTPPPAAAAPSPIVEASAEPSGGAWPDVTSPPAGPHCPWCSAPLPSADLANCPACGAQLNAADEADVPGVTKLDVAALAWKAGTPPRRSKILSWISGDSTDDGQDLSGASASAIEPPSLAVRREMLRLELEAEGINLPDDTTLFGGPAPTTDAGPADAEPGPPEA